MFQKPYCLDLWGLFDGQSFLMAIEHFSSQQTLSEGVRTVDGHWCARLHLLGFCLLACACTGLQNSEKEKRIGEAIRCFFQFVSDSSVVDVTSWNLRICVVTPEFYPQSYWLYWLLCTLSLMLACGWDLQSTYPSGEWSAQGCIRWGGKWSITDSFLGNWLQAESARYFLYHIIILSWPKSVYDVYPWASPVLVFPLRSLCAHYCMWQVEVQQQHGGCVTLNGWCRSLNNTNWVKVPDSLHMQLWNK